MSDLLARLIAVGTPADLIGEVAMLIAEQKVLEKRRRNERERKAKSRDVTGSHETERDSADSPFLDKEKSPRPPKEIKPIPERETRTRGTVLPVGWKPEKLSRDTISGQIIERRGQEWARRTLESFDNHWRAKSGRDACKRDWQATWANWVIEQDRRDGKNGTSRFQQGNGAGIDRTIAAAIDVFGHPDDPPYQATRGHA